MSPRYSLPTAHRFSSRVNIMGVAFGMLKFFNYYSVIPGVMIATRDLIELPWPTIRTFFPLLMSGEIFYCQRGLTLFIMSDRHSLLGRILGSISLYMGLLRGCDSWVFSRVGGGISMLLLHLVTIYSPCFSFISTLLHPCIIDNVLEGPHNAFNSISTIYKQVDNANLISLKDS